MSVTVVGGQILLLCSIRYVDEFLDMKNKQNWKKINNNCNFT